MRDFDGDGREIPLPLPDKFELPLTVNMPPQPVHYVRNDDTSAFMGPASSSSEVLAARR